MRIIEIAALSNGAHRNQSYPGFVPDGWAIVPATLETENFPFGEVEVAEANGVMTVTKWTPGVMPEPEPEPMPEPEPTPTPESTIWEELDYAYQEGVDDV